MMVIPPDGPATVREAETCTRPVSMEEVRSWLEGSGFEIIHLWAGCDQSPFTGESGRATFWACKEEYRDQ
jgi:hypothetical protein